ncbi:MAG: hypothetical protein JWN73_3494 [Betaproteobacteria bacterium]|nr:hypothetical protein [Betaproteobacteria bacterium]
MKHDPNANLAGAFVPRHSSLRPLAERAAELIELRRLYRDNLPSGLAEASQVANFRDGVVIVMADNSAAAAKLKQLTSRLTAAFQEKGWQINAIKVQVQARA